MSRSPKILIFDVETSPVKVWAWRTGKQYVTHDMIVEGQKFDIICICYKWVGEKTVHSLDWGLRKQDSREMIEKFEKVLSQADVVIAHNADNFDIKQINTQRLLHKLPPLSWPTSEDTLKSLRKQFYATSFKLDYWAKMLFGGGKDRMCFGDWVDIVDKKCPKALAKMIKYCKKDVKLLEKVWKEVRAHIEPKANKSLIVNGHRMGCPSCGSEDVVKNGRSYRKGVYQMYSCKGCGHVWRDTRMIKDAS